MCLRRIKQPLIKKTYIIRKFPDSLRTLRAFTTDIS